MKKFIKVKTQFERFHRWKDAPDEVSFLRNMHRHIFKVEVVIPVNHSNRELEFFIIKKKLDYLIETYIPKEFEYSCEYIAELLYNLCKKTIATPKYVEISEDGENSGIYGDY